MNKKKILIIAPMQEELDAVAKKLSTISLDNTFFETESFIIHLFLCGIGKVSSAISTTVEILNFKPDFVFNVGVGGGFSPDLEINDVVIATKFIQTDVDVIIGGYEKGHVYRCPKYFPASSELLELVLEKKSLLESIFDGKNIEKDDLKAANSIKLKTGVIGTSDAFIHTQEQIDFLKQNFPEIICVDMEGGAIAHVCHHFGVPVFGIRSISDNPLANKHNEADFQTFLLQSANTAAEIMTKLIVLLQESNLK